MSMRSTLSLTASITTLGAAIVLATASQPQDNPKIPSPLPAPVVPGVQRDVQAEIDRHLRDEQSAVLKTLRARAQAYPALFKTPLVQKGLGDPWGGMVELEQHGLALAGAAQKGLAGLPALLDLLSGVLGKPAGEKVQLPLNPLRTLDDHANHLNAVLDRARAFTDAATAKLTAEEKKLLFTWAPKLIRNIGPQLPLNDQTRPILQGDKTFCTLIAERCDWAKLVSAAKVLASLADPDYLASLKKALEAAQPIKAAVPGVTGDILLKKQTRHGLILFGGKGPNTYDLNEPVAVLVDLGGDDIYKGILAASFDAEHPLGVLIDFAGDDTYECAELGLATGRAGGVGFLLDLGGNDTYKLAPGSGGTGFGGIGILCDADGDDVYTGSLQTQGAAIAGIGLLLDLAGNDRYTSWGLALGFGGPVGVGAVIDVAGNDFYQCGQKFPSGYNQLDAPKAKPGDPAFQYDCFGMAMGLGRRTFPPSPESNGYNLAGGVGIIIDLTGDDRSESSNFSQACGYFFGTGLKLDLAGNDVHGAARYGHAAGAHYGLGLFIDYAGKDTYTTTGPTYNCGCAWDHSAFLFIDAGTSDDRYQLERSSGLGTADIGGWAVCADLGGNDFYRVGGGLGSASQKALAVFFDRAGDDDYSLVKGLSSMPGNGRSNKGKDSWLFVDR
jgi:hypothetical protein